MLPCMPNQLQLYPVQLKCKLEYKSHYMYDMIWKDRVMGAIMWLKQNNHHYKDLSVNEHWSDDVSDDGVLQICIDEHNQKQKDLENTCTQNNSKNKSISNTNQETEHQDETPNEIDNHQNNDSYDISIDQELAEDQAAIDRKQNMIGDALPSVVEIDNMENTIFQCAPGENNIPKYVLLDEDFEVLAFPDLFPYGSGGYYSEDQNVKLQIRKYFQQCLLNVDICFAQNIEYLFCAQHIVDLKHIQSEANLAIRLSRGRTLQGNKVTAGLLHNPERVTELVRSQQAYKFLRNIRGSPAYWQHELQDVMSMLHSLGIPTWFLTLSAADLHWPEMIQAVAIQLGRKLSCEDVLNMSIQQRSEYLRQNPVTGVRMFQHRLQSFFSEYILSSAHPIGKVKDYVIKIEFQM